MMTIVAIILVVVYATFVAYTLSEISKGRFYHLLYYLVCFLPVYVVFVSFTYAHIRSPVLTTLIRYSKEIVVLYALVIWFLGRERNVLRLSWQVSNLDFIFLTFIGLCGVYLMTPIGEATFINKAVYFKNILLFCLAYFFGRQVVLNTKQWKKVFKLIFGLTVLSFFVVALERLFQTHFHTLIGYATYNLEVLNIEPQGNYGLKWTFEAQGGQPRYASVFANPLDFSASMLISFALAMIHLIFVPYRTNRLKYLTLVLIIAINVLLAYSRSTLLAFFIMIFFMALTLKLYKILAFTGVFGVFIGLYVMFFASDEMRYFVEDTIRFQNSSSITHALEWFEAVESISQNPFGIGLATSGNAGGVDDSIRVGGENQYLIFGVQLGVLGMLLYLGMVVGAIWNSWKAFRVASNIEEKILPFVAGSVKVGLLLPLFTANAETYLYLSLVSWWMVGAVETFLQDSVKVPLSTSL